jgi:poly-gamma-glutamate capsule biosynthesis protein CapA/YwtB (metallophosphatase superfamily)
MYPSSYPSRVALLVALVLLAGSAVQAQSEVSGLSKPRPSRLKGPFKLVTIGELLYSHPMYNSEDSDFQIVAKLVREADVTIAEQEGVILNLAKFKGLPGNGGLIGSPDKARDEKAMGIDMVALANNHSNDWGYAGLAETERLLDAAGVAHAGSGRNLTEARKAAALSTPHGRIAMVSTASTFRPLANATDAFGDAPARPGISVLRTNRVDLVKPEQFSTLRSIAIDSTRFSHRPPGADATEITLNDTTYRPGPTPGVLWEMNAYDHADLMHAIREAKQTCDFVIFTIHAHESPTGMDDDNPEAARFLVQLFHDAIDAGADLIYGHGQHSLRGIEIYKGRPVFYGVGAYFLSGDIKQMSDAATEAYESPGALPPPKQSPNREVTANPGGINPPVWYDGMVAITQYEGPTLKEIRLYPLDLGNTPDKRRRGIPHLADAATADRILKKLRAISAPFGTTIELDGSVGVIRFDDMKLIAPP